MGPQCCTGGGVSPRPGDDRQEQRLARAMAACQEAGWTRATVWSARNGRPHRRHRIAMSAGSPTRPPEPTILRRCLGCYERTNPARDRRRQVIPHDGLYDLVSGPAQNRLRSRFPVAPSAGTETAHRSARIGFLGMAGVSVQPSRSEGSGGMSGSSSEINSGTLTVATLHMMSS